MAKYRLSNEAKNDLIRIHHFGFDHFGMAQADLYLESFFDCFDLIAQRPFTFEAADHIRKGYRRCSCGSEAIYYRVQGHLVEIMAIVGRQDLKNVFGPL
jgi:toxin ParE1/3/4